MGCCCSELSSVPLSLEQRDMLEDWLHKWKVSAGPCPVVTAEEEGKTTTTKDIVDELHSVHKHAQEDHERRHWLLDQEYSKIIGLHIVCKWNPEQLLKRIKETAHDRRSAYSLRTGTHNLSSLAETFGYEPKGFAETFAKDYGVPLCTWIRKHFLGDNARFTVTVSGHQSLSRWVSQNQCAYEGGLIVTIQW